MAWPQSGSRLRASGRRMYLICLGIPKCVLLGLLRGYQWAISPMLLPSCRYVPTCSEYAADAIDSYGALRGSAMAVWRLLRCHPFVKGGYDPVPPIDTESFAGATLHRTAEGGCPHMSSTN